MVTRKRLRTILTALGLYTLAALLDRLFRRQRVQRQPRAQGPAGYRPADACAAAELGQLKHEHAQWRAAYRAVKSDDLDPDMLDERARALLDYAGPTI
jgi:cell division protein FtsB